MARRLFRFTTSALTSKLASSLTLTALALPLCVPLVAHAEDSVSSDSIANTKMRAMAQINSDGVYVRSGPGDNYYPTMKLNKSDPVTVVGEKFDWLKIIPPKGSFCYVAKAFVEKGVEGAGTSNRDDVNVRAGSDLNTIKTSVQTKLSSGTPVTILGEVDEYYKIVPPADAYVYVKKDFVEPVKVVPQAPGGNNVANSGGATGSVAAGGTGIGATGAATTQPTGIDPTGPGKPTIAQAPTSQPAGQPAGNSAAAEAQFDALEKQFNDASNQPIDKQPIAEMTAAFTKLLADAALPDSMKQLVDYHMQTLKVRAAAQADFASTKKMQNESVQKQVALKAEQEEIAQQIKQKDVKVYTAVGTLRTSSLQQGNAMLYRLTDPQSGRTVCYIRSDDAKYGTMLGQFIGVKGEITTDPGLNLKVVSPTEYSVVDPNQLYRGVGAQIVPPSLLPQAAVQASATETTEK